MIVLCLIWGKSSNKHHLRLRTDAHNIAYHITKVTHSFVEQMSFSLVKTLLTLYSCYETTHVYTIISMGLKQLCSFVKIVHTLLVCGLKWSSSWFSTGILVGTLHKLGTPLFLLCYGFQNQLFKWLGVGLQRLGKYTFEKTLPSGSNNNWPHSDCVTSFTSHCSLLPIFLSPPPPPHTTTSASFSISAPSPMSFQGLSGQALVFCYYSTLSMQQRLL